MHIRLCPLELHSFLFIRIYFIRISKLKFAKFNPKAEILKLKEYNINDISMNGHQNTCN